MAQNIPATAYIVNGLYYNTTSLPHEMGHCLGLYHTHHGTVNEGGDINQCAELVNGSNSATCGDYISDTPADPNSWSSNSCNYTGAIKDSNGQSYNPNPSNFMAYSYKPCRNLFSALQSQRMNDFIANTPMLQNVITPTISGPSDLFYDQSGTYSISHLPPGATVSWSTSRLSPNYGTDTTFTTSPTMSTGSGFVQATITVGQTVITLRKDITFKSYINIEGPDIAYLSQKKEYFTIDEDLTVLNWQINGQVVTPYDPHRLIVLLNNYYPGSVLITCTVVASFGIFEASKSLDIIDDYEYLMYPNPATDLLTISLTASNETGENNELLPAIFETVKPYNIQLWNERSGLIKTVETEKSTVQIPLNGLPKGLYYIHVIRDKNTVKKQILWIK